MRVRISEALYLACYISFIVVIYVFIEIINRPGIIWMTCPVIALLIYVSILFQKKCTNRDLILRFLIVAIFGVAAIICNKPQVLVYAALLCGADVTTFRKICISCFITCIIIIFGTASLSTIGVLKTTVGLERYGVTIRTFGFGYYACVPYTFLYLTLIYLYLKNEKQKKATWVEIGIILVLNYIIFSLTTLRLTYYLIYLAVILYIVLIKWGWVNLNNRFLHFLTILVFPALFAFSIWTNSAFTISNPNFIAANRLLSNRLFLGHQALQQYHVNLFGNRIVTYSTDTDYFYIDSGYLFSLLGYGLIFTALMLAIYIYLYHYSARTNNKMLFIWLTVIAIFSFSNNTWISMQLNPMLLCFPIILKHDGSRQRNEALLNKYVRYTRRNAYEK